MVSAALSECHPASPQNRNSSDSHLKHEACIGVQILVDDYIIQSKRQNHNLRTQQGQAKKETLYVDRPEQKLKSQQML